MNLIDFLHLVRRSWILLLVGTLVGVTGGAAFTVVKKPSYSATSAVYVSTGRADNLSDLNQGGSYAQQVVKSFAAIATTDYVLKRVISDLHLKTTPDLLATEITATADTDTTIVTLAVKDKSAPQSAAIANELATQLKDAVGTLTPSTGSSSASVDPIDVTQLDFAATPKKPTSPILAIDLLIGLIAGFGLALVGALLREKLRTRIRSVRDLARTSDLPVLGMIGAELKGTDRIVMRDAPRSREAEAVRSLRANLAFVRFPTKHRVLVVTSSQEGEGKSTTAANLAIALADAKQSVVLVDADLRRPRLADRLGLDGTIGLSDVLIESASVAEAVQQWSDRGVDVLPAGSVPPNPSELLQSDDMRALIARLRERYTYVLVDAPPVLPVADAMILADITDGALVVCELGRTRRGQLAATLEILERSGARLLGLVANKVPRTGADAEDSTAYGYGYGYSHDAVHAAG